MIIYLAGVPGGNQATGEVNIHRIGVRSRMLTFYYANRMAVAMRNFAGIPIDVRKYKDWKNEDKRIL